MRKLIAIILILALMLSIASATEYTDQKTLKAVQAALKDKGYDCQNSKGTLTDNTVEMIKAFQEANSLETTGTVNFTLLEALGVLPGGKRPGPLTEKEIKFGDSILGKTAAENGIEFNACIYGEVVESRSFLDPWYSTVFMNAYRSTRDYNPIFSTIHYSETAAGYPVDTEYFFVVPIEDGKVPMDCDKYKGILWAGVYHFKSGSSTNTALLYEDLKAKLKSVYGKPYLTIKSIDALMGEIDYEEHLPADWNGERLPLEPIREDKLNGEQYLHYTCFKSQIDGNMIILFYDGSQDTCNIYYLLKDCDKLIEKTLHTIIRQQNAVPESFGNGDTNGL